MFHPAQLEISLFHHYSVQISSPSSICLLLFCANSFLSLAPIKRRAYIWPWMQQIPQDRGKKKKKTQSISLHRTSATSANSRTHVKPKSDCGFSRHLWSHGDFDSKYALGWQRKQVLQITAQKNREVQWPGWRSLGVFIFSD